MPKSGSLLEKTIKRIFDLAGFKTKQDIRINDYEIDVFAKYLDFSIAIECKERETGSLVVRNLIHEWAGKQKMVQVNKVLLAVYGVSVKKEDRKLAEANNISIWDGKQIEYFIELSLKDNKKLLVEILDNLDIKTEEVMKQREDKERQRKLLREKWQPDIERIKEDYDHRFTFKEITVYSAYEDGKERMRVFDSHKDSFPKEDSADVKFVEPILKRIYDEEHEEEGILLPISTLIFAGLEIGEEEFRMAEKYGVKCIVCKGLRNPDFFTHNSEAIKSQIRILTVKEIYS